MKSYSEWLPEARVAIAGADDALLNQQIAAAIREFFTRATWTEMLFPITLVEDRDRYSFGPLASYYAVYLMTAKIGDRPIYVYPTEPLVYSNSAGVWVDGANDQVVVNPVPNADTAGEKLYLEAAIKPRKVCDQVPDRVFEMFFDEILMGSKARCTRCHRNHGQTGRWGRCTVRSSAQGLHGRVMRCVQGTRPLSLR